MWLYSIKADNNRVFHHYSTLVKQRKISRGEYEYYQEKIKINEEMGGLFIPQPSELPTNIICNQFRQKLKHLKTLLAGLSLRSATADMETEITHISYDSRTTAPGDVFVAMTGFATDGHALYRKGRGGGSRRGGV